MNIKLLFYFFGSKKKFNEICRLTRVDLLNMLVNFGSMQSSHATKEKSIWLSQYSDFKDVEELFTLKKIQTLSDLPFTLAM